MDDYFETHDEDDLLAFRERELDDDAAAGEFDPDGVSRCGVCRDAVETDELCDDCGACEPDCECG